MSYAEILFDRKVGSGRDTLVYAVPDGLVVQKGQAVEILLRGKSTCGVIVELNLAPPAFKTQPLQKVVYEKPVLTTTQIELLHWMARYYLCPRYKLLKLFIPSKILKGKPIKERKPKSTKPDQIFSPEIQKLNKEQKAAYESIISSRENTFLVQGVTGSGKTELYTHLARAVLKKEGQVLILVPEISLTPQMIEYFERALGMPAAILHSKRSEGEKQASWQALWKGEARLIIGSRSALFAPCHNLQLVIVDEEHETSYKQDKEPRYQIHEVLAAMQSRMPELKIVYGSATPRLETAQNHEIQTVHLTKRIGESTLPQIQIVDLREEFKKGNYSIFSDALREALTETLSRNEQALLFLNRRGAASAVVCRDCGYTTECKECTAPMTYHTKTLRQATLICHHCGHIASPPEICPNCKSVHIRYLGIGTQKIEEELKKEFPTARILRADKDTTSTKHGFEEIYQNFRAHKADILIGTQMIAKGLHLPKVQLVGIILADIGLHIPDFRAAERNFQLLSQVSGRAGRSNDQGKVIIQTYSPDNIALKYAARHDYTGFQNFERTQRKILNNPPFARLLKITAHEKTLEKAKSAILTIETHLKKLIDDLNLTEDIELNTYPPYFMKLRNTYQYLLLLKSKGKEDHRHKLLEKLPQDYIMNPSIKIDIDPISVT